MSIFVKVNKALKSTLVIFGFTISIFSFIASAEQMGTLGQQAPNFKSTTLSGEDIDTAVIKNNKPIYLKFWATWCSYCKEEMPHLQETFDQYGNDIQVLAINIGMNDSVKRIKRYFAKHNYHLPVIFDEKGELVEKFNIIGTPQHILINGKGEIVHRSALITDDLHHKISQLISKER